MNRPRYHILLIFIVGLLAYSNTFNAPFHFDDTIYISENPIIKNLQYFSSPSMAQKFENYPTFYSRYIGFLTFALNYQNNGIDVVWYHIINLAIHIINALLVYWLVILTFRTPFLHTPLEVPRSNGASSELNTQRIALFSALLFVSHPIQTQAVTYIWQRVTSLATLFYLLSLVLYIRWRLIDQKTEARSQITDKRQAPVRLKSVLLYLSSVLSAVLAMKTKEIALTLPLVITLYEFMFFEGAFKKRALYLLPLIFTMTIIPWSFITIDKPVGEILSDVSRTTKVLTTMSRWDYLFTQFRVIVTYIRLLFLPINQNLDYDYPLYHSFFDGEVMLSFLFLMTIFGLGVYLFSRSRFTSHVLRLAAFGIFWFFITLSVESSVIPIIDVIFEHRLYLPSVGALITLSLSIFFILNRMIQKWPQTSKIALPALAVIIIIFSVATYARNGLWTEELSLWADAARKSPHKERPHINLGLSYVGLNRFDDAIKEYQIALQLNAGSAEAHYNLGNVYLSQDRVDETVKEFEIATKLDPKLSYAHYVLGNLYSAQGRLDDAIAQYQSALKLKPSSPYIHNNLGIVYMKQKNLEEAIKEFETALMINPAFPDARENLHRLKGAD